MNRFVRVEDGEERLLASLTAAPEHNGGRIVITANDTLFVGTGENARHDPAQDPDSLLGKVLRMTLDGEPVDGNMNGIVYSYGHRNVYALAMDPETGALWAVENMGWRRDEINIVEAGGNYGYPECEGYHLHGVDDPCPRDKGYTFPIITFYEDRAAAPAGAAFWQGGFYWGSFNEGSIHHTWQEASGVWNDTVVYDHPESVIDLLAAPDGALYFSALDGIWRISFPDDAGSAAEAQAGRQETGRTPATAAPTAVLVAAAAAMTLARPARRR